MPIVDQTIESLRVLSDEELKGVVALTHEQIEAVLRDGEKERDAFEAVAKQPHIIAPNVRFR